MASNINSEKSEYDQAGTPISSVFALILGLISLFVTRVSAFIEAFPYKFSWIKYKIFVQNKSDHPVGAQHIIEGENDYVVSTDLVENENDPAKKDHGEDDVIKNPC